MTRAFGPVPAISLIYRSFHFWPTPCLFGPVSENGENRNRRTADVDHTKIQNAIVQYVNRHPESCDTALGVARWWLPHEGIEASEEAVYRALAELVDRGELKTVVRPGGETHFLSARRTPVRS